MSAHDGSMKVIMAAMLGNLGIAGLKFGAAYTTGSVAMFSEAIHSLVDTGNQVLLAYGLKQSRKPADDKHPYGYHRAIYFWGFIVALVLFFAGGIVSFTEGWEHFWHPTAVTNFYLNIGILLGAVAFESYSFSVAYKEFKSDHPNVPVLTALCASKNPAIFVVLVEDTVALIGLMIALIGSVAGYLLGIPWLDGLTSMIIGVVLFVSAIFLARETLGLVIGEGVDKETLAKIREIVMSVPGVVGINDLKTEYRGPEYIDIELSLDFDNAQTAGFVEQTTTLVSKRLRAEIPDVKRVSVEVQSKEDSIAEQAEAA